MKDRFLTILLCFCCCCGYCDNNKIRFMYKCCEKGEYMPLCYGCLEKDSITTKIDSLAFCSRPQEGTYLLYAMGGQLKQSVEINDQQSDYYILGEVSERFWIGDSNRNRNNWQCWNKHLYDKKIIRCYDNGKTKFIGTFKKGRAICIVDYHENGTLASCVKFDRKGNRKCVTLYDENGKVIFSSFDAKEK